jgi:catechol 2,3-dioxygenase-like lactoylglutathione lyase family enzyme
VHHVAYVVDDLEAAARRCRKVAGIGPFLVLPHVVFDEVVVDGEPAVLDHTPAFAAYGNIFLELQEVHRVEPVTAADRFRGRGLSGLHHIAHVVADAEAESERLSGLGLPLVFRARTGPVSVRVHDAHEVVGTHLEIHQAGALLTDFFDRVRSAAENWSADVILREVTLG